MLVLESRGKLENPEFKTTRAKMTTNPHMMQVQEFNLGHIYKYHFYVFSCATINQAQFSLFMGFIYFTKAKSDGAIMQFDSVEEMQCLH